MASTIKDVAKMADVSISTVSRVINESKPVSPETRRRVLHAIEVLDYKPNEIARSLVTKKSNLIGVIVGDLGTIYTSQILRGVEEIGRMYNYDILVASSYGNPELEIKFAKLFSQKQVEGIIVISEELNQKLMFHLDELKIPYININRFYELEESQVILKQEEAAKEITEYVIGKGHKKIAYVAVSRDLDRTVEKKRIKGYKEAMEENKYSPLTVYAPSVTEKGVREVYPELKKLYDVGYTAFVCTQDEVAIHICNMFAEDGIKVPEDLSLTGFGGAPMTDVYRPKITTIKIPYYDIGAVSIRKILKVLENKDKLGGEKTILPTKLLDRDSVRDLNK